MQTVAMAAGTSSANSTGRAAGERGGDEEGALPGVDPCAPPSASGNPAQPASVFFFVVELIDPQINFLDTKTHSSLIIVAGRSSLEGRKYTHATLPPQEPLSSSMDSPVVIAPVVASTRPRAKSRNASRNCGCAWTACLPSPCPRIRL